MKKILSFLFLSVAFFICTNTVNAMSYEEAIVQSKPFALLVYADWADDVQAVSQNFSAAGLKYASKYNFVSLNIASKDAKAFNKSFHIYPNLPYVLLFRDKGKFSRYLNKECIMKEACFNEKLDFFVN